MERLVVLLENLREKTGLDYLIAYGAAKNLIGDVDLEKKMASVGYEVRRYAEPGEILDIITSLGATVFSWKRPKEAVHVQG